MNNTILNKKEADLIDNIILQFGTAVTFDEIFGLLEKRYKREYVRKIVVKLVKNGWLVRIKKGVYCVSDLANRGTAVTSQYLIANIIGEESYVSFGFALQYYGMFDQLLSTITSVSLKQYSEKAVSGFKYKYVKTSEKYFFGWQKKNIGGYDVRIASIEKALIDIIQFSKSAESVDIIIEKVKENKEKINFSKLNKYLEKASITVAKTFGFIFDLSGIDSRKLYEEIGKNKTLARIDNKSKSFNSKWRVYYNKFFNKYL